MPAPEGFEWSATKDGRVRISHHGRVVTTLAGAESQRFLGRVDGTSGAAAQQLMARATGNYKHGNER